MRKFLVTILAAVFALPLAYSAVAGNNAPPGGLYGAMSKRQVQSSMRRYGGDALSIESATSGVRTTTDRFEFGFQSNWVHMCVRAGLSAGTVIYVRFEYDAEANNWADRVATQSSYYIDGVAGVTGLGTKAMVMSGDGDGTDARCVNVPVNARGITVHNPTSAAATLDVIVF